VFASEQVAIGVAGKLYADGSKYTAAGQTFETAGAVIPVTGTLDYFFTTGFVRPYVGGDAGVYFSGYEARYNGNVIFESKSHSNFGAAPRAGLVFALGNLGIQVEGIYHFVFGNRNHGATTGSANNVDFKSTSKFGGINVGLILGLGGK
jgi:outer membrane protein W